MVALESEPEPEAGGARPPLHGAAATTVGVGQRNELSTLNGCFVPCLITILGATLFLRLGFAVGIAGLAGAMGILLFSGLLSVTTVTSFSAICSNGRNGAGGAYFMISRSLGMPFGAASGLLFWISYSLNATFNTVAFTDIFQSTFVPADSWWSKGKSGWSSFIISSITLLVFTGISLNGAGSFAKANVFIGLGLAAACVVVPWNLFTNTESMQLSSGPGHTYSPFSLANLQANMWPEATRSPLCSHGEFCTTRHAFSTVFPAVIGMMEGLNLIGDLKNPEYSIPVGTFWALVVSLVVYVMMLVAQAGTLSRLALQQNMNVLQEVTVCGGCFVVVGIVTACLSTVLGALFGASRILQAMARDDVFPGLSWFKQGTPVGDEPRAAVLASFAVAQAGLLLGSLDEVGTLLTLFFLLTYCLTDLSCVLLAYSPRSDFKPTFRFYSWQTSLLNSIVIVCVMVFLSWKGTLITSACFVCGMWAVHRRVGSSVERARILSEGRDD